MLQVLAGLAYLHQQGVVHRDIKGANILTNREGLVKLADFGVAAKLSGAEDAQDKLDVVGTTYWMAPEVRVYVYVRVATLKTCCMQVIEMTGASSASDIWSVGCLAVELLTGVPPYYELQPMPALFRIVQDTRPPLPPNISPGFEAFLVACFHKVLTGAGLLPRLVWFVLLPALVVACHLHTYINCPGPRPTSKRLGAAAAPVYPRQPPGPAQHMDAHHCQPQQGLEWQRCTHAHRRRRAAHSQGTRVSRCVCVTSDTGGRVWGGAGPWAGSNMGTWQVVVHCCVARCCACASRATL